MQIYKRDKKRYIAQYTHFWVKVIIIFYNENHVVTIARHSTAISITLSEYVVILWSRFLKIFFGVLTNGHYHLELVIQLL